MVQRNIPTEKGMSKESDYKKAHRKEKLGVPAKLPRSTCTHNQFA